MNWVEKGWYRKDTLKWLNAVLLPFTVLYWALSSIRKSYIKPVKKRCPVVVVGNISVGGNGKTPFVIWLCETLIQQGYKPGVISRGYGGQASEYPLSVSDSISAHDCGDEPKLIHTRIQCPVVVGSKRNEVIDYMLQQNDIDVIISDDGMQHYAMDRAIEIAIVDAERTFGNGWLMPVGPLRELPTRLEKSDFVIYNGKSEPNDYYELLANQAYNLITNEQISLQQLGQINGICGIGNPQRFKNTLDLQNADIKSFSYKPDHHKFVESDFSHFKNEGVVMTEKDAVKCASFAKDTWWYLPVSVKISDALSQRIITKVKKAIQQHGI